MNEHDALIRLRQLFKKGQGGSAEALAIIAQHNLPLPVEPPTPPSDQLIVAHRLKGKPDEHWHRSFINEVYPNLDDAVAALPAWITATGKYMGERLGKIYYPTRGEVFDYDVVRAGDAVCQLDHYAFIEELGYTIHKPLKPAEIAEKANWRS